jgi:hypothetical protein
MNCHLYLVCSGYMNLHDQVPVLILHVLETDIPKDTSVVDEHIDAAECADGSLYYLLAELNAVVVSNSLSAGFLDLVNDDISGLIQLLVNNSSGVQTCNLTFEEAPSPLKEPPKSFTTTLAPRDPKKTAYALPNPPPAPVTTTV